MKILIIGGTRFLGRHLVHSALGRGHQVTLFNRGLTNPDVFPQVETILGDREKDLAELLGHEWEAVIDTCGYVPRIVRLSAQSLEGGVSRYVFISSISVYAGFSKVGIDETDPVGKMEDETVEEITGATYGPLKALCERAVQETYSERALVIRPGLIVGPYDPTDRFTYWPVRVARGGNVLAPEGPDVPIQIMDGRDLSDFIIKLIEEGSYGVFNATGPEYELTMGAMLETCKQASKGDANFKWASVEFLGRHEVAPWSDMPVWIPNTEEDAGFSRVDISKAIKAGLKFRPLEETVRDTLEWAATRPSDREWRAGLTAEKEAEVLAALMGE
jgi:nucleoside-diphosphate-sugar epimerase